MAAAATGAHGAMRALPPVAASATGVLAALRAARAASHAASGLAWTQGFSEEARLARSAEAVLEAGIAKFVASGAAPARGRRGRRGRGACEADEVQAPQAKEFVSESDAVDLSDHGGELCRSNLEKPNVRALSTQWSRGKFEVKNTFLNLKCDEQECSGSVSAPERLAEASAGLRDSGAEHVGADSFYMGEDAHEVSVQTGEEQTPMLWPLESPLALWAEAAIAAEQVGSLALLLGERWLAASDTNRSASPSAAELAVAARPPRRLKEQICDVSTAPSDASSVASLSTAPAESACVGVSSCSVAPSRVPSVGLHHNRRFGDHGQRPGRKELEKRVIDALAQIGVSCSVAELATSSDAQIAQMISSLEQPTDPGRTRAGQGAQDARPTATIDESVWRRANACASDCDECGMEVPDGTSMWKRSFRERCDFCHDLYGRK